MFADKIDIIVRAGNGGNGRLSFRHEKYRAMGGPDGGDGGRGGNVVFRVSHNLTTLAAFRKLRKIDAESGHPGGGDRKHGRAGEDVIVPVPIGTQIYQDGELLMDLAEEGQSAIIAKGGRGGFGNAHFTSSTRQAPRATELGEKGQELSLSLELKLVADVGLVGLPNAGKSTLLSVLTNAKPAIGDYPFTTLTPNLGVVDVDDTSILMADIPGLIEGASKGKGLGDDFLRHVERTAVLLHLIDMTSETIATDYITIVAELQSYQIDLTGKPRLVVPTKIEAVPEHLLDNRLAEVRTAAGLDIDTHFYPISSQAHRGLNDLMRAVVPMVKEQRQKIDVKRIENSLPVIDEATQPNLWKVEKKGKKFVVTGENIESFARRTNWDSDASVERLRDILHKRGVSKELVRQGITTGTIVTIGGGELIW